MHSKLAEIYNTNGYAEALQEKLAAMAPYVDYMVKRAEEEGAVEELQDAVEGYMAETGASEDEALADLAAEFAEEEGGDDDMDKESAAVFEEHDLAGRIMAHAFNDEMEKIAVTPIKGESLAERRIRLEDANPLTAPYKDEGISGLERIKRDKDYKPLLPGAKDDKGKVKAVTSRNRGELRAADKGALKTPRTWLQRVGEWIAPKYLNRVQDAALQDLIAGGSKDRRRTTLGLTSAAGKDTPLMESSKFDARQIRAAKVRGLEARAARSKLIGGSAIGGGAALLGGAGYGAYRALKGSNKESQVANDILFQMAQEKAAAFLEASNQGVDVTFDKVASLDMTESDRLITETAWEILRKNGYVR